MSEWRDISTAPTDTKVMMGCWYVSNDKQVWDQLDGIAFESRFFGLFRCKTFRGRDYTHWQPLPEPPSKAKQAEETR